MLFTGIAAAADDAPANKEGLVYSVRLVDSYRLEQRGEAQLEIDYLQSIGLGCRIQEGSRSGNDADNMLYILCGKAPSITALRETVNKVRQNHLNFLIVTVPDEQQQKLDEQLAPAEARGAEPARAADTTRSAQPSGAERIGAERTGGGGAAGRIVYTIRLSNTYEEDQEKEAQEELEYLKSLDMDCRLQVSEGPAAGSAMGKKYYILCGQAETINGLQETVNKARRNHFNFLITLAPYAEEHELKSAAPGEDVLELPAEVAANKEVAEAYFYFNKGDIAKAQNKFYSVLREDPNNVDANFGLALVEVKRKNWTKAYTYIKPLLNDKKRKDIQSTATMILYNREMEIGWDLVKTSPDKAVDAFMRARKYDKTPETMEGLAYAYYHKGDYDKALPIFDEMFKQKQDEHLAEMIIAVLEKKGDEEKMVAFYNSLSTSVRSAMSYNPEKKQTLSTVRQCIETGEYRQAERLLKEMYLLEPGNVEVLSYFGWLYLEKRDPVKAEEYYRSALSVDPYNVPVMRGLAGALMALEREEEAMLYLQKVAETGEDVSDEKDKAQLAIYIRKHQLLEALGIAARMEEKNPNDPAVHMLIAGLYMSKGEMEKAFNYYSRAYQLDQDNFEIKMRLLGFFLEQGKFNQIKMMLETFKGYTFTAGDLESLRSFYLEYYDKYSEHLMANQKFHEAKLAALSGLDLAPDDQVLMNRVAWVSLNLRDYNRAAYYFQLALRQDPENMELCYGLGLCYLNIGDDEKALEALDRVENSGDVDMLYKLADVYQQIGSFDDALRVMDKANQITATQVDRHPVRRAEPKAAIGLSPSRGSGIGTGGTGGAGTRHRDRLNVFNPFAASGVSTQMPAEYVAPILDMPTSMEPATPVKRERQQPLYDTGNLPRRILERRAAIEKREAEERAAAAGIVPAGIVPASTQGVDRITEREEPITPVYDPAPLPIRGRAAVESVPKKKITHREPVVDRGGLAADVEEINRRSGTAGVRGLYGEADEPGNSSLAVGEYFRGRSGDKGLGRLTEVALSFDGLANWNGYHYLYGFANQLWLKSGIVQPQHYPIYGTYSKGAPIHDNIGSIEVIEPGLGYLYDGPTFDLRIDLGFTPLNAVVDEQMTWRVKYSTELDKTLSGFVLVEEAPVRDSFLAFVGERDLYTDLTWGGVTRQGLRAGFRYDLDERWEAAFELFYYPSIEGEETISNSELGATLLVSYDLELEGFEYFSVGPLLIYDSYEENTNFFTYGHGGYFSPQKFILAGLYFDFLRFTETRKSFLRLTGNVGYLSYHEASSKKYPFDFTNNEYYPENDNAKLGTDLRFFLGHALNNHWSVIGTAGLQSSSEYTSYFIGASIVYHFDTHPGMYVSDLKRSNIISRYLLE